MNADTALNEITIQYKPIRPLNHNLSVTSAYLAYRMLFPFFETVLYIQEKFVVLYLNNQSKVIGVYTLATGSMNNVIVDIRLLLSVALKTLATKIIVAHNHPSGDPTPSKDDIMFSKKLYAAAKTLDIQLLDHIIIADNDRFESMASKRLYM